MQAFRKKLQQPVTVLEKISEHISVMSDSVEKMINERKKANEIKDTVKWPLLIVIM